MKNDNIKWEVIAEVDEYNILFVICQIVAIISLAVAFLLPKHSRIIAIVYLKKSILSVRFVPRSGTNLTKMDKLDLCQYSYHN